MNGFANGTNGTTGKTGFLSFNSLPPRLWITSEDDEFDEETISMWREEGFHVTYHPLGDDRKAYVDEVKNFANDLKLGELYAIIAYGDAAAVCLDIALKPLPRCCVLVCFYPTQLHANANYPTQLNLVLHLSTAQPFAPSFPYYRYPGVQPGFAEHDLDEYDEVSADLAWSRSLKAVRKGFKKDVDLEQFADSFVNLTMVKRDAGATVAQMTAEPKVIYGPTLTGGIGRRALLHFYKDFFAPGLPPTLKTRLISRTTGANRVVDEMAISFRHSQEMSWILPGVPPTDKEVQVVIVSIIAVHGGKLAHEHVYWDQASVLQQIGALDAKNVPKSLSSKGCKRLPIVGADAAKKIMDSKSVPSNGLIPNW